MNYETIFLERKDSIATRAHDEIFEEVVKCRKAGASIVHLHAKAPKTGMPHPDPNLFPE